MKLEKMKAPVSGHYIPIKHAAEIYSVVSDADVSQDFVDGALFALGFLTCPRDEEMHGAGAADFLANYQSNKNGDVPPEVLSAARATIEMLKAHGVEVVDAYIVSRGDL